MKSHPKLVDATGRPLTLDQLLASGGEGAVYTLMNDTTRVAKVYHKRPTEQTVEKLTAMTALATPKLLQVTAWPEQLAFDKSGSLVGFVMPRLVDFQPLQHLYNPVQRLKHFPRAGWNFQVRAAMNCAAAFDEIHSTGCLIGDINQSNVQVSAQALVKFIDCDSFQIPANGTHYLCEVGVAHYTPPELQGQSFRGLVRTENHDRYGLAVLIFQLLFVGRHPYAGIYQGTDEPSFEQLIAEYRFAHSPNATKWLMAPPPFTPTLGDIPPELGKLFRRAFERGAEQNQRPEPTEWIDALKRFESEIAECETDDGHKYWKSLSTCPWCRIAKSGGPEYYFGASQRVEVFQVDEAKLQEVERRLVAIKLVEVTNLRIEYSSGSTPIPQPLDSNILRHGFHTILLCLLATLGCVGVCLTQVHSAFGYCGMLTVVCCVIAIVYRRKFSLWPVERRRRRSQLMLAITELLQIEDTFEVAYQRYRSLFRGETNEAQKRHVEWKNLTSMLAKETRKVTLAAERRALLRFLKLHPIADAEIPSIGESRKRVLAAHNILTAGDITESEILQIKGFGPVMAGHLKAWRDSIVRTFQFDPSNAISPGEQLEITQRFFDRQNRLQNEIYRRILDLEHLTSDWQRQLAMLEPKLYTAIARWEQAAADARVMGV